MTPVGQPAIADPAGTGGGQLLLRAADLLASNGHAIYADEVRCAAAEIERLREGLARIEKFGHSDGHGRGFTCANMAQELLKPKLPSQGTAAGSAAP